MKLIVDILEEDYKECKFRKDLLSLEEPTELTFNMRMETLIANGTPVEEELEKIKEKISKLTRYYTTENGHINLISDNAVYRIIDKEISELKGENK